VLYVVADGVAKDVQDDLANDKEENAKADVTERPAVLQGTDNEDDLADDVDEEEYGVDDVCYYKNANGVLRVKASPCLESEEGNSATDNEHAERAQAQQPDRKCGAILVQLETDEAVDQQAGAKGRRKSVLRSGEVWVGGRAGSSNAGI
jgi:hypothetical protein